jgi:hypothetical protein
MKEIQGGTILSIFISGTGRYKYFLGVRIDEYYYDLTLVINIRFFISVTNDNIL